MTKSFIWASKESVLDVNDITFVDFLMNKTSVNPYESCINESNPLELDNLSEEGDEEEGEEHNDET